VVVVIFALTAPVPVPILEFVEAVDFVELLVVLKLLFPALVWEVVFVFVAAVIAMAALAVATVMFLLVGLYLYLYLKPLVVPENELEVVVFEFALVLFELVQLQNVEI